jgi:hypothetical protein
VSEGVREWPRSPVQRERKFSAVRGTVSRKSSMTTRPSEEEPTVRSRNTTGLIGLRVMDVMIEDKWVNSECGSEAGSVGVRE